MRLALSYVLRKRNHMLQFCYLKAWMLWRQISKCFRCRKDGCPSIAHSWEQPALLFRPFVPLGIVKECKSEVRCPTLVLTQSRRWAARDQSRMFPIQAFSSLCAWRFRIYAAETHSDFQAHLPKSIHTASQALDRFFCSITGESTSRGPLEEICGRSYPTEVLYFCWKSIRLSYS